MKRILFLFFLPGPNLGACAQPIYNPTGAPYAEAVACTPSFTDAMACAENPAALPYLKGFAAAGYMEKKYLITGLNLARISIAYGKKNSGAGIAIRYFGNIAFHEIHSSIYYGKSLGDVQIGASVNYSTYSVTGFNKISVATLGFFTVWKLSERLYSSLQLINPPFGRLHHQAINQNAEYRVTLAYEASPQVCASFEFQKIEGVPLQVNTSVQYRFGEKFYSKIGLYTAGPQPFFGLGWVLKDLEASFCLCYHPVLGATPGILVNYRHTGGAALP